MHCNIFRSFTLSITVITIIILINSCVKATGTSDDRSTNDEINVHDNSLNNLKNVQISQSENYPKSPPVYQRFSYNNLFMTMIINSLVVELKNLANNIKQVNKNMITLMNHQLETTNDGSYDYSRAKRQAGEESFKNNHKIPMFKKAKEIPLKKIIINKNSPKHKNFKRKIISYFKKLFNDNQNAEYETSKISRSITKDYSTTECYNEDDTTLEENIHTSKTSTTTTSSPLSALQETTCKTEEISSTSVVNTGEMTEAPMPIATTTIRMAPTITNNPPSNDDIPVTTCDYDTETEETEPSVTTNLPLVHDHTDDDDDDEDHDDNDNSNDDCVNPLISGNSRKLLGKLMNINPFEKQSEEIDPETLLKLRERNLQINRIKLMKNLKIIKRKASSSSNINNLKVNKFPGMRKSIQNHMKIGRTLKSYEFIEPDKQSIMPTIMSEGNEYDYDNTREINEVLNPNAEGSSENFNTTLDKSINEQSNNEKLVDINLNVSNNLDNLENIDRYCTSCICDIEYALMNLKGILELRSDILNRISRYSCDKFVRIGKYLDLTSASLSRRRALDETVSYNSAHRTLIEINDKVLKYIQYDDAEDLLSIDEVNSNEYETLYIPESSYLINIPCRNDNKMSLIRSESQPNYTWIRHDGGPISGIIRDNGDLELYQVGRALNVGNYSCIMTHIDPDDKELIKNIYEHTIKSVTLPQYIIRGVNHYKLDNLDEYKLETLFTYLKHLFNDILCKYILCDTLIFAPEYKNHNVSIKILIIPSNILNSISPAVTSLCDVKCHRAIQNKIILLLIHNFRIILQKPIIFRLSNHRHGRLVPIKKDENAELKAEQKQKQEETKNIDNDDTNGDVVGLLVGCPIGYRLDSSYCEPCPSGFYSQDLSWDCQQCPLGTYQPKSGAKTCEKCTNPFINSCFFMLWPYLSIALIVLVILLIMILVGIISFWPMCCEKRNKKYKMYTGFSDSEDEYLAMSLLASRMNSDDCHNGNLICNNSSCEQNDIDEDSPKKKLLIYGINLLPTRRMSEY